MTVKQLVFREEARDKIRCGVDAEAEAVKVSLGLRGRTVILDRDFGAPQIANFGDQVANSSKPKNRLEGREAQLLREVASRTSERVGNGTSNATSDHDKAPLDERISMRSSGVALIMGAAIETELKPCKTRLEVPLPATGAGAVHRCLPGADHRPPATGHRPHDRQRAAAQGG